MKPLTIASLGLHNVLPPYTQIQALQAVLWHNLGLFSVVFCIIGSFHLSNEARNSCRLHLTFFALTQDVLLFLLQSIAACATSEVAQLAAEMLAGSSAASHTTASESGSETSFGSFGSTGDLTSVGSTGAMDCASDTSLLAFSALLADLAWSDTGAQWMFCEGANRSVATILLAQRTLPTSLGRGRSNVTLAGHKSP